MIRITRVDKTTDIRQKTHKVIFYLKASRDVWIRGDKLIIEYPLQFTELRNLGEAAILSLLPIAYHEDSHIKLPDNLKVDENIQYYIDNICAS